MTAKASPITTALHPQQDRFLRLADVEFLTGLRRASIYALGKAGTFPKAVHITGYSVAWRKSELEAWMAERLAMRDGAVNPAEPQPAQTAAVPPANARRRAQAKALATCETLRPKPSRRTATSTAAHAITIRGGADTKVLPSGKPLRAEPTKRTTTTKAPARMATSRAAA